MASTGSSSKWSGVGYSAIPQTDHHIDTIDDGAESDNDILDQNSRSRRENSGEIWNIYIYHLACYSISSCQFSVRCCDVILFINVYCNAADHIIALQHNYIDAKFMDEVKQHEL